MLYYRNAIFLLGKTSKLLLPASKVQRHLIIHPETFSTKIKEMISFSIETYGAKYKRSLKRENNSGTGNFQWEVLILSFIDGSRK